MNDMEFSETLSDSKTDREIEERSLLLAAARGSASGFVVTQDVVNEIVKRAEASSFGLSCAAEKSLDINQYADPNLESLAILLVSAWTGKYDLIAVFYAAMQVIKEKTPNAGAMPRLQTEK